MRGVFLIGRAIFGGFFVYNGLNHFLHEESMSQYARSKHVAAPDAAVNATGALLLGGGLSVVMGLKPRLGLVALVTFLVPTTLRMHRFWAEPDSDARMNEMVNFAKNLALAGAALALMQIDEPWPLSVDELRSADEEEMFVRLGGRDLLSLPA